MWIYFFEEKSIFFKCQNQKKQKQTRFNNSRVVKALKRQALAT